MLPTKEFNLNLVIPMFPELLEKPPPVLIVKMMLSLKTEDKLKFLPPTKSPPSKPLLLNNPLLLKFLPEISTSNYILEVLSIALNAPPL